MNTLHCPFVGKTIQITNGAMLSSYSNSPPKKNPYSQRVVWGVWVVVNLSAIKVNLHIFLLLFWIGIISEWSKMEIYRIHLPFISASLPVAVCVCMCMCVSRTIFLFFSLNYLFCFFRFSFLFVFLSIAIISPCEIRRRSYTYTHTLHYSIVVITLIQTHAHTWQWTHLPENRFYNIYSLSWSFGK